jgi:two-component system OmpR family sensor kinase
VGISAGKTVLRIQDSGPGIPLAERERVFAPFYRTLGSEQIGSGLGLSIVQTIAHRIGAEIRLDVVDETQKTGLQVDIIIPAR